MTNIKGFALVAVGILIFTSTCVFADETYSKPDPNSSNGKDLKHRSVVLFDRIRICQLLVGNDSGANVYDPAKIMQVQGTQFAGRFSFKGLAFELEIIDVSGAPETYSRSIANGNPIQTASPPAVVEPGQIITLHSAATILVGPDEAHPARVVLRVWEV